MFNTNNPLGSTDPRDLSDNSEVFDEMVNNLSDPTVPDRFGNPRVTLANQVGFRGTGVDNAIEDYSPGIELTTYNTIIRYDGEFYSPSATATLPYITTATLPDADSNLVARGDAVLRQDLEGSPSDGLGAALVNGSVIRVGSVAELDSLTSEVGSKAILGNTVYTKNQDGFVKEPHPFYSDGVSVRPVDPVPGVFRGLSVNQFILDSGESVYAWREGIGHGNENPGTSILVAKSDDYGYTLKKPQPNNAGPIYTQAYFQNDVDLRHNVGGVMGSGRLGIVVSRVLPDDSHQAPKFIYSDDDGDTWNDVTLPMTEATANPHGRILKYPSSVGGDDTNGYIVFCYKSDGSGITAYTTVNNGASWAENVDVVTPSGAPSSTVTEICVERIAELDQWVMLIRAGGSGTTWGFSTSTDLLNWSSVSDTGITNDDNPPEIFYANNALWILAFSRENRAPHIDGYKNALVICRGAPSEVFSSNGVSGFSDYSVVSALPFWPTGYGSVAESGGRFYYLFTGENYAGSTQSDEATLYMLSSDCAQAKSAIKPSPNLFINGAFSEWPLGTTITGTSRDVIVPGLTFARQGEVGGWTITRRTGEKSRYAMRIRRDDGDTNSGEMRAVINLPVSVSRAMAGRQATVSFRVRAGSGFSAADNFLRVNLRQSSTTSEQRVTDSAFTFPTGDSVVGTNSGGFNIGPLWNRYSITPARIDVDSYQVLLAIIWSPTGTASEDWIEIEELKIEVGDEATPFQYEDPELVRKKCSQFVQVFDAVVTDQLPWQHYLYPEGKMRFAPSVVASVGSVFGSPSVDGVRIENDTIDSTITSTVTAKTFL